MIKKLVPFLGEYKKATILTPIMVVFEVVLELMIPLLMARIVDYGIQGEGGMSYTIRMGLLMILMAIVALIFGALSGKFAAEAGMGFAKNIRSGLFEKIQGYSFANVDKFTTASLVTRLTTDVTNTQNAFMMIIRMAIRAPIMLIGATIMAVSINAQLSLIFLISIPVLSLTLFFIGKNAHPRFLAMLEKYDGLNEKVQDFIVNIRVVKAFVREDHEESRFIENAKQVRDAQLNAEKLVILNMPIMQLTIYTSVVAILWFGGNMVIDGTFNIGQMSSFIMYIMQVLISLMMISMIFIMMIISRASFSRIIEGLEEKPTLDDEGTDPNLQLNDGTIEFKNVSFSYTNDPENVVLNQIDLSIKSGETIGIIGGTGSSKTTLVQLIPRLYDILSGEVVVGGHNVKDYRLNVLRDNVAMVLQNNVLFSGTIKDNLKWGNEHATDEEVKAAAKAAQAHDFITSFPNGYDTDLGQGGVNVSGGQKQRLTIARALLKNPKVMILDDSTSAVDTATDAKIRTVFKDSFDDVTTLIIAQRVSSISDADRIIVLDDGEIKGFDTHENLMRSNEIYQEIYESQSKGVSIDG
ncbi:ATP-binding cassette, subfamily B [Halolactibacillus halophilus]|uniref:ABC transporter n=1 Tax=Halolactibacillus halophilus TaxID=306540 RepID=A0A1I5N0F7_9BACI|nr:ABC transporter ATP-binding protein [Halolactibacillus halophilus]GEM01122.1 ABC transporter [Halolactibacillus halophilus]SFP14826.1 ATP-binding cassette, subfamily B [Halolactibacillus halophilus]